MAEITSIRNSIRIINKQNIFIGYMLPGQLYVDDEYFNDDLVYMRTPDEEDDRILCVSIQTGDSHYERKERRVTILRYPASFNVKSSHMLHDIDEVPYGGIFSFSGYPGEMFIKPFIKNDRHELICRCYSLSTGIALTDSDADVLSLPVMVHNTEIIVTI